MEGDTTDLLRQHNTKLDRGLKGVMPDSWKGHGRLAIRESEAVPESIEEKAIEKMNKLADKKGIAPERAANSLIKAIQKKQE